MGELAMWLFGNPDNISSFNNNSDNSLTSWTGAWADYIKTYLFFLYIYEQYGGRVGNDLIHEIIASPARSIGPTASPRPQKPADRLASHTVSFGWNCSNVRERWGMPSGFAVKAGLIGPGATVAGN